MIKIVLPWPPRELHPNARVHFRRKAEIAKEYKARCKLEAEIFKPKFEDGERVHLFIMFYPKSDLADIDGMLSNIKHGIDGIADAWRINDKIFRPCTLDVSPKDPKNPRVEVFVKKQF